MKKIENVVVYGDIHGCLDEFKALRKKLQISSYDKEIVVGDFLNKGPKSLETMQYLIKNSISSVMGNNEEKILSLHDKYKEDGKKALKKMKPWESLIVENINDHELEFLKQLPYFIKIENLTVVHGGIPLGVSLSDELDDKTKKQITLLRYYNKKMCPITWSDFEGRYRFWSEIYDGRDGFVIFGHHPFDEPKRDEYSVGIDTGCVYGEKLHAVKFKRKNSGKFKTKSYKIEYIESKKNYLKEYTT